MLMNATTKYVYRDIASGRLIHQRDAEQRPADTWVRESFAVGIQLASKAVPDSHALMQVDEEPSTGADD